MRKGLHDEDFLKKIGMHNLILFALSSLEEKKKKADFEAILKECFSLFPKIFCFSSISKWPDARKIDRPLRSLRSKKLIQSNDKGIFSLTKKGRNAVEIIVKKFSQKELGI